MNKINIAYIAFVAVLLCTIIVGSTYNYTSNTDALLMEAVKTGKVGPAQETASMYASGNSFWVQTGGPLGPRK